LACIPAFRIYHYVRSAVKRLKYFTQHFMKKAKCTVKKQLKSIILIIPKKSQAGWVFKKSRVLQS